MRGYLRRGYLIFQNFQEKQKDLDITKVLKNAERLEKQKFTYELFDYLHVHLNMKKKISTSASTKCKAKFVLCFISKNEEYKPKENIPNSTYLKNLKLQKILTIENNQLKCGDYSLLFSMHTNDDEQYFK